MWWALDFEFYKFLSKITGDEKKNTSKTAIRQKIQWLPFSQFVFYDFIYSCLSKYFIKFILSAHDVQKDTAMHENLHGIILIVSSNRWWQKNGHNEYHEDYFFDPIIKNIKNKYELIGTYRIDIRPLNEIKHYFSRLAEWRIPFLPYNYFWSVDIWRKELNESKKFEKVFKIIKNDENFRKLCIIGNKDYYQEIINEFEFYFRILLPYAIKTYESFRGMIQTTRPNAILISSEYAWAERSLIYAAKQEGVPVVAIQHGNITPDHRGYIYGCSEISEHGSFKYPFCPIADKTAVFGEYYREMLTKASNYPGDSVVITGQPRFDEINNLKKRYNREVILEKFGIVAGKKCILWTTQCHGMSDDENNRNFEAVFTAMKEIPDSYLIIKQHPREGPKYSEIVNKFKKKYPGINVVSPHKKTDIYELLVICDVIITKFSTTASEAIFFDKPLIILNLSGKPDKAGYVEEGVAEGVYSAEELQSSIINMLENGSTLADNRKKYIERYLNNLDGTSTERISSLIDSVITSN